MNLKNGKNLFCHKMSSWEKTQLKKRIYLLLNKEKIETPNINFVAEKNNIGSAPLAITFVFYRLCLVMLALHLSKRMLPVA